MCACTSMTKYFLYTCFIILIGQLLSAHGQFLNTSFFYQNKTQRCNCEPNTQCNKQNGTCQSDKCVNDYFGTNCQHANVSLAMTNNPTKVPPVLLDGDDTTCMTNYTGTATFQTDDSVHFIWVYIFAENPLTINPTLTLYDNVIHIPNIQVYYLTLSEKSLLIKSDIDVTYDKMEISGLPKDICSLEVSLGRNLAMSSTHQYSTGMDDVQRTTDGIDGLLSPFTFRDDTQWYTRLLHNAKINHIKFNVAFSNCQNVFLYLSLKRNNGIRVHNTLNMLSGQSFLVASKDIQRDVFFNFTLKKKNQSSKKCVVDLYEIYIFGEFQCPKDRYGERCERYCPYGCGRDICDPDWGCPSGCKNNWTGEFCDQLNCHRRYGTKCEWPCSENCNGAGDCSRDTGHCLDGCKPGFQGKKCTDPCPTGSFGADCSELCGNCKKSRSLNKPLCDPVTGKCVLGCEAGLTGDVCNQKEKKRGFGIMTFLLEYGLHIVGISGVNLLLVFGFIYLTRAHNQNDEQSQAELYEHSPIQSAKHSTDMPNQEAQIVEGEQFQLESHELSTIQSNVQPNLEPNEYTQANELSQTKLEEQSQSEQHSKIIDGDNESTV